MMERRRALTIPFSVNKDNLMENPLKIPITRISPDCGKLENQQVPWTAFAGCKLRQRDSPHKNGSTLFEHPLDVMDRRKPRVILEDVLKTDKGRDYIEKVKRRGTMGNRRRLSSSQRESGHSQEEPVICRETRSNQKSDVKTGENKNVTPKRNQRTPSSPNQRSRVRRRLQSTEEEEDGEESTEIQEVMIGKDNGEDDKFAEVVDCGLSVSWKPAEDTGDCDEFSPASIKDRLSDPEKEVQHSSKRKRNEALSQCNGTGSPKRHRVSVLRLMGEDKGDRETGSTQIGLEEESGEYADLESLDHTIVQFTVGADDQTEILIPIPSPHLEAGDSTAQTKPSEPIVLSSDDEEGGGEVPQRSSPAVLTLVTVEDAVSQGETSEEAVATQQEASELVSVIVEDIPSSVSFIPDDYNCLLGVAFTSLHCGGFKGTSNGDLMITNDAVIIPITDTRNEVEVKLCYPRQELRRYSVWKWEEMEALGISFNDDEDPLPAAVLMLFVSEAAAASIQSDLLLCDKQDRTTNTDKASPFILLAFRDPLETMVEALLKSYLQMDALAEDLSLDPHGAESIIGLEDNHDPDLSLADSIMLIRTTGCDCYLFSLLGLESADSDLNTDQDSLHSDTNENTAPVVELEDHSQEESAPEPEGAAAERDSETQPKPEEEPKEQEPKSPAEKKKEDTTPVYTLCHRRASGSYSVSLCKPDPKWTKYKHQGLAHRLIQFPPPPLKGGITVTMEDLQCLDSGQFLNDVIIDFYLKYLLQNASDAVAQGCHIFSSFFYKQLTRRDNASEGITNETCQRQRRHQRVKTWTRHVDIFKKDFLFVPVNQEAHWYLVVICFPGLEEPTLEMCKSTDSQDVKSNGVTGELQDQEAAQGSTSPNDDTEKTPTVDKKDKNVDIETEKAAVEPTKEPTKDPTPGPVNCTQKTCQKEMVCKRPCILIMDSLKLSLHERVFKLLRDYLQSEWEVRRGSSRDFSPDQMQSSHCQVPLQDNSSDCGLYLLQYVESFLKDPVVHFDLPLHLHRWFPRQQVRRKRDEIRDLVLHLYRKQKLDGNR
ncbi:sentrin-specific protease 7 isoform X2 [Notolabrus celidotus]|uniref:sentrin-specific protease 7 isoform X2 n=1 Tax=Notolabrus celidotus TaxID=1203425 RepID=UPI00148FDF64|nr:sentrin-specific protease 7 isoform X2 [Notolabrus celidotus]